MSFMMQRIWGALVFALSYGAIVSIASRIIETSLPIDIIVVMAICLFVLAYVFWPVLSGIWKRRDASHNAGRYVALAVGLGIILVIARMINQAYGERLTGRDILIGLALFMAVGIVIAAFELRRAQR